jgi:hypothetical protein
MVLMMSYRQMPFDREILRTYQRDEWGMLRGETCVIELSGLAAHSFKIERDRECFREERIATIRQKILQHQPELVVMYGKSEKPHWEKITGQPFPSANFLKMGKSTIVFTTHPVTHGLGNSYWVDLGRGLR